MKTIMKTKIMKVAIFMMIMAGMLESMIGNRSFAWGQTCEIAFSSDTNNVNGWALGSGLTSGNCMINFKSPLISAIGGDTLFMKSILFNSIVSDTVVDWVVLNESDSVVEYAINTNSFFFELSTDTIIRPFGVYCVPANTLDTATFSHSNPSIIMFSTISAKFVQSAPSVVDSASKSLFLNISDFGVVYPSSPFGSYDIPDSVRWFYNGSLVPFLEGTIKSINPADYMDNGSYSIEVKNILVTVLVGDTVQHEGVWSQRSADVVVTTVSVFENETDVPNITIYPNPVKTMLNISEEIEYSIFSITGQMILSGYGKEIDVSYFKPGMYFLRTINESHKFIVE